MKYIETFREGMHVSDVYLCKTKQIALTKNGKEYGSVTLQDKTGTIEAKIWDPNSMGIADFDAMDYVEVYGDILLGLVTLKLEKGGYAVYSFFALNAEVRVCRVTVHAREHAALVIAKSAHGSGGKPGEVAGVLSGGEMCGNEAASEIGGVEEISVLTRFCLKKLGFNQNCFEICVFKHSFGNAESEYVAKILDSEGQRIRGTVHSNAVNMKLFLHFTPP